MKFLRTLQFTLLFLFVTMEVFSSNIEEIRKSYKLAIESSKATEKLSSDLNKIQKPDPIILAYKASIEALKAKHEWNPIIKLQHLDKHKMLINTAIKQMPSNLEIRYLRYNVQVNVPSYLGYSTNVLEDKNFIVDAIIHKKFNAANKQLALEIFNFMVSKNSLSVDEKHKMQKAINSI